MALAAMAAVRGRGLDVPSDISLVSFDDTPIVRLANPPLTAITQPVAEGTAQAVELIIAARAGHANAGGPIVIPPTLAVRNSTRALAPPA